ncbi:AzlD domain-containing protein [Arcobacter sp. LA11]|uniref:AzlD domain-containing protein n=1 Tax=Arcobacter sp. LA11 TaxID=1898176 RepID=UPI000932CFA4|nr:AzlD domain-containing protein [Arcobacter sp. LA11]
MNDIDLTALFVIFCVAIGTYSLRVSGLLLSNKLVKHENIKIFLDYLPATLLLSLVVPSILKEGVIGVVAILFIALFMYKTRSILLSMVIGVLIVAISRNFL